MSYIILFIKPFSAQLGWDGRSVILEEMMFSLGCDAPVKIYYENIKVINKKNSFICGGQFDRIITIYEKFYIQNM